MKRSVGQMARKVFWNAYDHLGGCILLNLFWSLLSLPWIAVAVLLLTVGWTQITAGRVLLGFMIALIGVQQLMVSPVSAALWSVTARWAHYQEAGAREFFPALRKLFGPSLGLWLFFSLAALLLALNVFFYEHLSGKLTFPGAVAAGLMVWVYLLLCLVQIYALAFLVREDLSIKEILRRSILVVLDNLWYSLCLALLVGIVLLVGVISIAGLLFVCVSLTGVIANTGLREVLSRYEPENKDEKPKTWAEIREAQNKMAEETRGWRDLWRPWER
ncbi:hypothetical protein KAX22_10345 [bacterium]|nr:hypothetical protein [bacterium]